MIATLRGPITSKDFSLDKGSCDLIVEAAGVGYQVTTTTATVEQLAGDSEVYIYVHHHITESDQRLFGFASKDARTAFRGLLAAHGVGPSLALAVLATHSVTQLAAILDSEDVDALCETPGVGKKTAQRLLVELRSSLILPTIDDQVVDLRTGSEAAVFGDVKEALGQLGYSSAEIRVALASLSSDDSVSSGELLKQALQSLGGPNG